MDQFIDIELNEEANTAISEKVVIDTTGMATALSGLAEATEEIVAKFDISKIVEALMSAFSKLAEEMQAIAEAVSENISTNFLTFLHSVCHWILRGFSAVAKRPRRSKCHISTNLISIVILCPYIKTLVIEFLEHICGIRDSILIHTHNRGSISDDSSDFLYLAA